VKNWRHTVQPEDCVIHLGDVFIGKHSGWNEIYPQLTGRKILIRGNHDRQHSCTWWMEHGFASAVDALKFGSCWLTHEPSTSLADGCELNIHGHLHNIWHGFHSGPHNEKQMKLHKDWQRLFAVEYTNYRPVEFDKFVANPDKYHARGLVTRTKEAEEPNGRTQELQG
jgi:calcineurin-like phosphoesterase family protein